MRDLNYALKGLCLGSHQGSRATQAARYQILQLCADQLQEAGFRLPAAKSLKPKHVEALISRWQSEGLSTGTIKNRMTALRWWADQVGKRSIMATDNESYGLPERAGFKGNRAIKLDLGRLASIPDPYVRMALRLQAAFGLRREEALKFRPAEADRGDCLVLKASWTKGGRPRTIPVISARQRALLDEVHAFAGDGSLIPAERTYIRQVRAYQHQALQAGISHPHGLRHAYAQVRYRMLTGLLCPAGGGPKPSPADRDADLAARTVIAEELGHGRTDVTNAYLGGRQ